MRSPFVPVMLALIAASCAPAASAPPLSPITTASAAPSASTAGEPRVDVAGPVPPTSPVPATLRRVVIRAGRVLDTKSGKVLVNQAISIENDKIVSVQPTASVPPSADTVVIDLPNATVLPGLVDAHTHLTGDPWPAGYARLGISVPRSTLIGARNARATLDAGFTTVRNVGAEGYADVALRDAIAAGDVPGPRVIASGPPLGITGGHCDENLLPFDFHYSAEGVADGVPGVQHRVREVIKYGADVIKFCASGGVLSKGDDPKHSQYTIEEMRALVVDAHRLGRKVAAHAHGAEAIRWASEAGVDSIEHGSYLDEAGIAAMKKSGTFLVPTLYLTDWFFENAEKIGVPKYAIDKAREVLPMARKNAARAFAAGVKVALGTDAGVYPHGNNAKELAVYVKLGMTPLRAIQSATVGAAELIGWSERIGTIEAGKWADIIAVDGDPLADVTTLEHVRFVMKAGVVQKNEYAK